MRDYLKITTQWAALIFAIFGPMSAALILMYSDVEKLKATKADGKEVMELRVTFTEQMARNTVAIESLNETLRSIRTTEVRHDGRQKESGD